MTTITIMFGLFLARSTFAATKTDCLSGNFSACKEILNKYGSTSDRNGATEFFANACASQNLKVICEVISTEKSETVKRSLEVASTNSAVFVISGPKVDKIYKVSAIK